MLSVQMSFRWTSKEIGPEQVSRYIVNRLWTDSWTYYVVHNVVEREIKKEKVLMKPPIVKYYLKETTTAHQFWKKHSLF